MLPNYAEISVKESSQLVVMKQQHANYGVMELKGLFNRRREPDVDFKATFAIPSVWLTDQTATCDGVA